MSTKPIVVQMLLPRVVLDAMFACPNCGGKRDHPRLRFCPHCRVLGAAKLEGLS